MTNNEKPYLEYQGTKYEFEANFRLKREYDKEIKAEYTKAITSNFKTKEELEVLKELQEFVENNKEITPEQLDEEMIEKLTKAEKLINSISLTSIYENYCFKMLNNKYNISKLEFEEMLEGFADEYGIEYVDILLQKVCEKVFTQVVEKKEKKALPSWMN